MARLSARSQENGSALSTPGRKLFPWWAEAIHLFAFAPGVLFLAMLSSLASLVSIRPPPADFFSMTADQPSLTRYVQLLNTTFGGSRLGSSSRVHMKSPH